MVCPSSRDFTVFLWIPGKRWPKIGNHAVVPYVFAEEIRTSRSALRGIEVAMAAYHKYTCIRFKPRSNEKNFITIVGGSGCASSIGMKDNPKYPQKVGQMYGKIMLRGAIYNHFVTLIGK